MPWTPEELRRIEKIEAEQRRHGDELKRVEQTHKRDLIDLQSAQAKAFDQHDHRVASMEAAAVANVVKGVRHELDEFRPYLEPIKEILPTWNDVHTEMVSMRAHRVAGEAAEKALAVKAADEDRMRHDLAAAAEIERGVKESERKHRIAVWTVALTLLGILGTLAGVVISSYFR